jgi:hypothetical protein
VKYRSPLGANHGWVVSQDFHYVSRELDEVSHSQLALAAVLHDPELLKIQKTLGYPVILRVVVGKYTLSVRIYSRRDVETRPDKLASRLGERDQAAFMIFGNSGTLELLEGTLREHAQGHRPQFYADRRLSDLRVEQLDNFEAQLETSLPKRFGQPNPANPFEKDNDYVVIDMRESPSLEPEHMRLV